MPKPLDLDAIEKRWGGEKRFMMVTAQGFADVFSLIARVREAKMLLGACRVSLGIEYPATAKAIDDFLAKLEAPDA